MTIPTWVRKMASIRARLNTKLRTFLGVLVVVVIASAVAVSLRRPMHERPWVAEQALLPSVSMDASRVHVRDVTYRSGTSFTPSFHDHDPGGEEFGVALGFQIFEADGGIYMAEAEISSYVDDPNSLGATLVFHSLTELDPTSAPDDEEFDSGWRIDIDDDLTRTEGSPMRNQFHAILRQLAGLSEDDLRAYLKQAREETGVEEAEQG